MDRFTVANMTWLTVKKLIFEGDNIIITPLLKQHMGYTAISAGWLPHVAHIYVVVYLYNLMRQQRTQV